MKPLYVYRIRKFKENGRVAPGIGKKIALHFFPEGGGHHNAVTSKKPKHGIPEGAVVLNYGRSEWPKWGNEFVKNGGKLINHPDAIKISSDKLATLDVLEEAQIPSLTYTNNKAEAQGWLDKGMAVIVRHILKGKQGNGVELISPGQPLPNAPLYTLFYDKTHEFRVHIVKGQVVDYVQKKRMGKEKRNKRGLEEVNDVVRNHKRGWIFAHNDILDFPEIRQMSLDAVDAVGLDLAAVDVLARVDSRGRLRDALICEVNSAPGMSSTPTFNAYVKAIQENYLDE